MPGMKATLAEFKAGQLHTGSKTGPVVTSRKQAIAIGLDDARRAGKMPAKRKGPKGRKAGDLIRHAMGGQ